MWHLGIKIHHEVQLKPKMEDLPFQLSLSCSQTQDSDTSSALPGVPADLQILLIGPYPTLRHKQSPITALDYSKYEMHPWSPEPQEEFVQKNLT